MSTFANSAPCLSQHSTVCVPSAVGGDSLISRAVGTYEVYWKMSPMSLRLGRCRMTRDSTLPSGPVSSPPHPPRVVANNAAPNAMLFIWLFTGSSSKTSERVLYKGQANPNLEVFRLV